MTENVTDPSTTPGTVVVGVDGSAASDAALLLAAREAQLRGAVLHVVAAHDIGAVAFSYAGGFDLGSEIGPLEEGLRLAAETLVKEAADTVATTLTGTPVEVRTTVLRGRPSQVLLDASAGAARRRCPWRRRVGTARARFHQQRGRAPRLPAGPRGALPRLILGGAPPIGHD